jgi:hypothetical protein
MSVAMKILNALLICCISSTVSAQSVSKHNDPKSHPNLTNKTFVEKIAGRPVTYYLNHRSVGEIAKLFYKGEFAASDDAATFSVIDSVLTHNKDTHPFYFFLFNQMMKVSDGALAEYVGEISGKYLKKFPCEFFRFADDKIYGVDLKQWSGFAAFTLDGPDAVKSYIDSIEIVVNRDCPNEKGTWHKVSKLIEGAEN